MKAEKAAAYPAPVRFSFLLTFFLILEESLKLLWWPVINKSPLPPSSLTAKIWKLWHFYDYFNKKKFETFEKRCSIHSFFEALKLFEMTSQLL